MFVSFAFMIFANFCLLKKFFFVLCLSIVLVSIHSHRFKPVHISKCWKKALFLPAIKIIMSVAVNSDFCEHLSVQKVVLSVMFINSINSLCLSIHTSESWKIINIIFTGNGNYG